MITLILYPLLMGATGLAAGWFLPGWAISALCGFCMVLLWGAVRRARTAPASGSGPDTVGRLTFVGLGIFMASMLGAAVAIMTAG